MQTMAVAACSSIKISTRSQGSPGRTSPGDGPPPPPGGPPPDAAGKNCAPKRVKGRDHPGAHPPQISAKPEQQIGDETDEQGDDSHDPVPANRVGYEPDHQGEDDHGQDGPLHREDDHRPSQLPHLRQSRIDRLKESLDGQVHQQGNHHRQRRHPQQPSLGHAIAAFGRPVIGWRCHHHATSPGDHVLSPSVDGVAAPEASVTYCANQATVSFQAWRACSSFQRGPVSLWKACWVSG